MNALFYLIQFVILSTLLIPQSAFALINFRDGVFSELASSSRALALGNAYMAKVDDSSAAFYNPAGLGSVRYAHFHLSNIHMEVNKDWIDLGTGGTLTDAFGNFAKGFSVDGTRELLKNHPGNFSHSRFHFMPNLTTRYFSAGYLYSTQARGAFGSQDGALYEYAKRTDTGPYAAFNVSLLGGVLKFGLTGIYLTRKEVFNESDVNTTITLNDADYKKGRGLVFIGGTRLTFPIAGLPTFAAKINNMTSQSFSASDSFGGAPDNIKSSVDLGFSLTPQIGKRTRLHFEVNYKDATSKHDNVGSSRKYGFGMELDMMRSIFLRLGYGDGFGSAGIGIRTRKLEFDLTTYAVDTTSSSFRGNEDRRFVMSLSSGF
jgi:hypothetical protein